MTVTTVPAWVRRAEADVISLPQKRTPGMQARVADAYHRLATWSLICTWASDDTDAIKDAFRDHIEFCQRATEWAERAEHEPAPTRRRRRQ